jgi:hypothetical protein
MASFVEKNDREAMKYGRMASALKGFYPTRAASVAPIPQDSKATVAASSRDGRDHSIEVFAVYMFLTSKSSTGAMPQRPI